MAFFNKLSEGFSSITSPIFGKDGEERKGLAANSLKNTNYDQSSYLNNQTSDFGRIGEELTNQSLRANPNLVTPNSSSNRGFLSKLFSGDSGAYNTVQAGLGIGQLGLGLASYLQQKEMAEKQGKLLDQQIGNNKFEMDNRRKMVRAFENR